MAGTFFFLIITFLCIANGLKLQQVLVFSRHNIRAPLAENLAQITPKKLPEWDADVAHLTPKGALLEENMGSYFAEWLKKEDFFTEECPNDDEVHIYANHLHRTEETAKAFAKTAFENCNLTVHFRVDGPDPVFYPLIHNTSEEFKTKVIEEIKNKLKEFNLRDPYSELNKIAEIDKSEICKTKSICDLNEAKNEIIFKLEAEPNVSGPLSIGTSLVDAFLMSYYNGAPLEEIAWGEEITEEKWKLFTEVTNRLQYVRFSSPIIASDVAQPLLKYISNVFLEKKPKFTLLVGHDSTLSALIAALGFEAYELPEQNELTPIGGKVVFQKWYDEILHTNYLKIDYVYRSTEQLRNGTELSLENPPKIKLLKLSNCMDDSNGYCKWNDFLEIIKSVIK